MTGRLQAGLERFVCNCFGTSAYGSLPEDRHGLSDRALAEARRDARYFAISNGIRAFLLVLLVWAMRGGQGVFLGLAILGAAFHGLLTWVEVYRFQVLRRMRFQGGSDAPSAPEPPTLHPFFGPHAVESLRLYRLLGSEVMLRIIQSYQTWARDERSPKLGPRVDASPSRAGAYELVRRSRQAEVVHLAGVLYDGILLWGCLLVPGFWWVIPGLGILMDLELVILQRSLRVRLRRLHRRPTASGAVPDLEAETP